MLAEAHKQMRASRFEQAAAQYQALRQAYPDSPEARTVLVSLAELQVDRLGSPELKRCATSTATSRVATAR